MTAVAEPDLKHELRALDAAHFLHPFTDHAALAAKGVRVITRAEGIWIWDADGHRILDGMSGLWCVNAGYGRRELAEAAYHQMRTLPFYNTFFQTTTEPPVRLARRLTELAPPVDGRRFTHVFFTSSGSEANDTHVRLVRRYWDLMGQPQRKVIISRWNAYHGSTVAAASLGGMRAMHEQGDLPIPGIVHIEQPYYWQHRQPGETPEAFGVRAARWLEEKILEVGPDKVAAFIAEPVQGAGGVIIPPSTYWPEVQRIVERYGILLISDEVICAFGRLGHWFAYERFGIKPDLVTFAKAVTSGYVPLGGVLVGERVARVLVEGGEFTHGYTYSGHPVACAVALANLDLMQRERLPERVRDDTGPYLAERFATLADHPLVGVAESCGMVAGLILTRDKATLEPFPEDWEVGLLCRQHCFDTGVVMRAVGARMIIAPPLVMTRADIDVMIDLIRRALDATWADLQRQGRV
ncbi:putative aminotransferase [Tepidimonas alkaliphilus]|uniref:Putative aminotransferase n=1 Tax=Tepidimonas alkaliphilus TaxID=2588942 RepID=A0A554W7V0_9BURK|nr:aspartate aminotransferase family protein [Tepidimonas alkaliphilus]TSE19649.1 putative aminotransferase [Tepidimonas alkaliphilus]